MTIQSINKDQRLYVLKAGAGVTCLGFDVATRLAAGVLEWLRSQGRAAEMILGAKGVDVTALCLPDRVGTRKHFAAYSKIMDAGRSYSIASGTSCPVNLTPQLIGLEGRRVEVVDSYGEARRFVVGKSMGGWMPCHIELKTRNSSGGAAVYGAPFKSVKAVD